MAEIHSDYFTWLKPKVTEIHETILGLNGFINNFRSVLDKQNEFLNKSTELQQVFAENLASHIPYVQNAAVALERITDVVETQQKQQTQFLETLQQIIAQFSNKNSNWKMFFPIILFFVLI